MNPLLHRTITRGLCAWLLVLFGVVVPMHDRGAWAARLDGGADADASVVAHGSILCPLCRLILPTGERDAPASPTPSPADPGSTCPICHFSGTLELPAAGLVLADLSKRLDWLAAERIDAHRPDAPAPPRRLAGRAPPSVNT